MNKIEAYKKEKDGLDVLHDLPRFVAEGCESIDDGDQERLKWLGVFLRRQTPGRLMMRVRMPNGISNSEQFRALSDICYEYGKGFLDITTRQQVQLRWFGVENVPQIWARLEQTGLTSMQTGMDNIRNVVGCSMAGLAPNELFDASPVVRELTNIFWVTRSSPTCLASSTSPSLAAWTVATRPRPKTSPSLRRSWRTRGTEGLQRGRGWQNGLRRLPPKHPAGRFRHPGRCRPALRRDNSAVPDHCSREARNKSRLAFLVEQWGAVRFRSELEASFGAPLAPAGRDAKTGPGTSHTGIVPQRDGLNAVGLVVPVGRATSRSWWEVVRLADTYGDGDIRITAGQNVIIPNVPEHDLSSLLAEPLLFELPPNPAEIIRGLVACTGKDYCHFSLIETKEMDIKTAKQLASTLGKTNPLSMRWSGCPNGCGNHLDAEIGILGKRAKINGEIVDSVDIFLNLPGTDGPAKGQSKPGQHIEKVPCAELPQVLEEIIKSNAGVPVHV